MIAASPDVTYISEPLNVLHRPGVMCVPTTHWYTYICDENQLSFLKAYQDILNYRYHFWLEIKSLRSFKDVGRMVRDGGRFVSGRVKKNTSIIKRSVCNFFRAVVC